jgi:hypothetical protein
MQHRRSQTSHVYNPMLHSAESTHIREDHREIEKKIKGLVYPFFVLKQTLIIHNSGNDLFIAYMQ